ncbi:MAG: diguanylate cyclase [Planctomycetes bacterium]|nr:diguanylate cyclase [Planctomycetota bacterium]
MTKQPKPKVLIVDDDPSALLLLERYLTDAGYEVALAENGERALHHVLHESPSFVITDWLMPGMNGLDLCRAIRGHEAVGFVYVIIITGNDSEDALVAAFTSGADDYLTKPCNKRELLARLRAGERIVSLERHLAKRTRDVFRYSADMEIANQKLESAVRKLEYMATTDELTGLINRRAAMARLDQHWARSTRTGESLACIIIDIDHFKKVNDSYGHSVGDRALKGVASVLRSNARTEDSVCRIGGEEFLVLCPGTYAEDAAAAAERLRAAVQSNVIYVQSGELRVTVSMGVAERALDMANAEEMLAVADSALYTAKREGRNRVCVAGRKSAGPPEEDESGAERDSYPQADPERTNAPTVLLIENDDHNRKIGRDTLLTAGYRVHDEPDAPDLIDRIRFNPPDVIIVGATSPNENDTSLVHRIKTDSFLQEIPVILAKEDPGDVEANGPQPDDYVSNPICPAELTARVKSMARLTRQRNELRAANEVRGEQARTWGLLLEFAQSIGGTDDRDTVLDQILDTAVQLTCCQRAALFLPNFEKKCLSLARSVGLAEDTHIRVPFGEGMVGGVFASAEALIMVNDNQIPTDANAGERDFFSSPPAVLMPLTHAQSVLGVLAVSDREPHVPFAPYDLGFLEMLVHASAGALHNLSIRNARDDARHSIVVALAKLAEHRDNDTGKHLDRVARFCAILASDLRERPEYASVIDDRFLDDLEHAVPLHDIGKVAVPDRILLKPGKLTPEEMEIMRTHVDIGAETIRSVLDRTPDAEFLVMAEQIAYGHHEWFDGNGYPRGINGTGIPLPARIVALADVYDALTTKRVYKDAFSHERAVAIIVESSGSQFDPVVVDAFMRRHEDFAALAEKLADQLPTTEDTVRVTQTETTGVA